MTQRITRMISISRDNIVQFTQQQEFFDAVPGLVNLQPQFTECRAAYDKSARERGCRCRADNNVLSPCMTAFIEALLHAKEHNQDTMRQFIQFVAKTPDIETTGVTIYYSAPDGSAPQRHSFP